MTDVVVVVVVVVVIAVNRLGSHSGI